MVPTLFNDHIVVNGGMKRVSTLCPGNDKVVEYRTNRLLDICRVERIPVTKLKVRLSDGTDADIFASDYTEDDIPMYPISFHNDIMSSRMYELDPYTIGALLGYGDYSDEFVNLPNFYPYVNQYIMRKNGWTEALKLGTNGRRYFQYRYETDHLVRWVDLFKGVMCNVMDSIEPIFPLEFATGSFRVRRQMLSGVFDVGYTKEPFDNRLQISNQYEERLTCVQDVLRSLGIISRISSLNDLYILTVTGDYDNTTGLFYNVENIEQMVRNNNWNMTRDSESLHIELVMKEERNVVAWVPVFADGRPHSYIDSNFLRRRTV